jgi:predicted DNA-binding antitoxin AbrB/MazE fold protein
MGGTIRARFRHGVLKPADEINLAEGTNVMLTIVEIPSRSDRKAFRRAAGGWKGTINSKSLIQRIYRDRRVTSRPKPRV